MQLYNSIVLFALLWGGQDTPTEIPKKDLPKTEVCVVCAEMHGAEKVAAGVRYKGKAYYFCAKDEVAKFKQDPEAYLPPVLPRPLPEFKVADLSGGEATKETLKGKVVLVDFWATWCKPCVETMPKIQKLHEKYGKAGLTVVGVSIDEGGEKKVKSFLAKRKFSYTQWLDADKKSPAWQAFGVRTVPTVLLVNAQGEIVAQWKGKIDHAAVEKAVEAALKATKE